MDIHHLLLTFAVTLAATLAAIAIAGCMLLYLITRKVRSFAMAARSRQGLAGSAGTQAKLAQMQKLARLMDSSIPIGIGGHRIGLDGLLDFIPGLGDVAGVLVSGWIIYGAASCGAPSPVLLRMAGNVAIDALLGAFPVLGVVVDSMFKANERNVLILEKFLANQQRTGRPGQTVVDVGSRTLVK